MPLTACVQQLALCSNLNPDDVCGVANIHGALAQVAALCKPESDVLQSIYRFLGVNQFEQVLALKDKDRKLFCLLDLEARSIMESTGNAQKFYEKMELLEAGIEDLTGDTTIEKRLNDKLRDTLELYDAEGQPLDLFRDKQVHDPTKSKLLLCLVAAECIKVTWKKPFQELGAEEFTTLDGTVVQASFCGDYEFGNNGRYLPFFKSERFEAVSVACTPEEDVQRHMILVLPKNYEISVHDALHEFCQIYKKQAEGAKLPQDAWESDYINLKYPKMNVSMGMEGGKDIIPWIKPSIPLIFKDKEFNPDGSEVHGPFDWLFPHNVMMQKGLKPAYVGKILHCASFNVDHLGAVGKASTAVVVEAEYRSIKPPPYKFHCNRPFGVFLMKGDIKKNFNVEFAAVIANEGAVRAEED